MALPGHIEALITSLAGLARAGGDGFDLDAGAAQSSLSLLFAGKVGPATNISASAMGARLPNVTVFTNGLA